jgi:5-methyltetrahydropteroyltriglutamate--homocysteine methyltransferase
LVRRLSNRIGEKLVKGSLMMGNTPPFRADHVGSLLRPQYLKDARARRASGAITPQQLKEIEDGAIRELIAKEEAIGLQSITDGEFRRSYWHLDFLGQLNGVETYPTEQYLQFKGGQARMMGLRVKSKITPGSYPMIEHFKFLQSNTTRTAKMTIPSPSVLHYRGGRQAVSESVYPAMEEFYDDLGQAYKSVVSGYGAAGCTYLQLDEVNFTYLCDSEQRKMLSARGDDPEKLPEIYANMINTAISGKPPGMRMTMHLCRGNFRSMWIASGGYDPVAELLFNKINIDGYFMEWDTERAGGFEPLRFVPKNKMVVLGLITSKDGMLESKEFLKRRLEEASRFVDIDQLCLSPQCGFASTEEGNVLTEEQQWDKLRRVIEVAHDVWDSK